MTAPFKLPEQNAIAERAARLVEAGADPQIVLGIMRQGGLSKIDSIKLFSELTGMPLLQAKDAIHQSRAWNHAFSRDRQFHAQLAETLQFLDADIRT
ncbi:MAG TPA: hypothetical protein VGD62_10975 [Acidobacteriaceae bacterium]